MSKPLSIQVELGDSRLDNQSGNLLNALDQVVSYYQANSNLSDEMVARTLELYVFQLTEDDGQP